MLTSGHMDLHTDVYPQKHVHTHILLIINQYRVLLIIIKPIKVSLGIRIIITISIDSSSLRALRGPKTAVVTISRGNWPPMQTWQRLLGNKVHGSCPLQPYGGDFSARKLPWDQLTFTVFFPHNILDSVNSHNHKQVMDYYWQPSFYDDGETQAKRRNAYSSPSSILEKVGK